jgi:hypothetical protein
LFNVDKSKLYIEVRAQNIKFTDWPRWIEKRMLEIHRDKQIKKK